jgi:hypothetical protein
MPVIPDSFFATDLVDLSLSNIPHSGYMTPQAMATCLSTLTRLKSLSLNFQSPRSRPDPGRRCYPPASRRSVLTALTELRFTGVSEYLEDLVARIDAPLLHVLDIRFFFQLIFDTPQLAQFIDRTPMLNARDEAQVVFSDSGATVSDESCQSIRWHEIPSVCHQLFVWHKFVNRAFLGPSFPQWNTSTSSRNDSRHTIGRMTSRATSGWNSFSRLPPSGISTCPRDLPHVLWLPFRSSSEAVQWVYYPPFNIFTWKSHLSGPLQQTIGVSDPARQLAKHLKIVPR